MNNMKYYNDSLAYDFERFMPRERKERADIVKMPEKKTSAKKRAATRHASAFATVLLVAAFALAALCGNIFLRLQINEVNTRINDAKNDLNALKSETTQLQVEVDRCMSYGNIEEKAAELGMVKCDKDQVRYITVNDQNAALVNNEIVLADGE